MICNNEYVERAYQYWKEEIKEFSLASGHPNLHWRDQFIECAAIVLDIDKYRLREDFVDRYIGESQRGEL